MRYSSGVGGTAGIELGAARGRGEGRAVLRGTAFGSSSRASLVRDLTSMSPARLDEVAVLARGGALGCSPEDAACVAVYAEQASHAAAWRTWGSAGEERARNHEALAQAALKGLSKGASW